MFLFQVTNSISNSNDLSDSLGLLAIGIFLIALTFGIRRIFKLENQNREQ